MTITVLRWGQVGVKVGIVAYRFHNLRHTCASLLLPQGVHPKLVQALLGHADIDTTLDTYSHVLQIFILATHALGVDPTF